MKILVINTGSSSIKYKLFDMAKNSVLVGGNAERIGESKSLLTHQVYSINGGGENDKKIIKRAITNHHEGLLLIADILINGDARAIKDKSDITAIGHRVVHGGETFHEPTVIDHEVVETIRANIPLAPLHNPPNLTGIEAALSIFPGACQVAVFDTAFHQTIPPRAFLYALPHELYEREKIRRYGFHGTSHSYLIEEYARFTKVAMDELNLITIHLGNGCSIAAIQKGKCVDTSMGFTPLEGLVMGTRAGDIDPSIPLFLTRHLNMSIDEIDTLLNKASGLKGLCGTNDIREVLTMVKSGNDRASLALEVYIYRIKRYIGAYRAILDDLKGLVFTAGVGENSPVVRRLVCEGLLSLGIDLDQEKNRADSNITREIGSSKSRIRILVIPANEELKIARETFKVVTGSSFTQDL